VLKSAVLGCLSAFLLIAAIVGLVNFARWMEPSIEVRCVPVAPGKVAKVVTYAHSSVWNLWAEVKVYPSPAARCQEQVRPEGAVERAE
jgi:hypothetical protein